MGCNIEYSMESSMGNNMECSIVKATEEDVQALADLFLGHIRKHKEYISHGEIQMGVGIGRFEDGQLAAEPAPDAERMWKKYITANISDSKGALVCKAVSTDGSIVGFAVAEIQEDGAEPFGMLCDLLVKDGSRTHGTGTALLEHALAWFRSKGISDIYLESGLNNHAAHEYFRRRGFVKVSEIFKLSR